MSSAETIADALALPGAPPADRPGFAQSLSDGPAGTALLHVERAQAGQGTWSRAHSWLTAAARTPASAADSTGLWCGAPALAFSLGCATSYDSARYWQALTAIDEHVTALAHRRVSAATRRVEAGHRPAFDEYDVFRGLTGIGVYLLRHQPGSSALERILTHLVTLTRPARDDRLGLVPGWWVGHDPHRTHTPDFPGGHANLGVAHGITGPLLLMARTLRRGITVDGQADAVHSVLAWLDQWRQDGPSGPWWPEYLTLGDLRSSRTAQTGPSRPSWCYGTPGIARAGQTASIALRDIARQHTYEDALACCLADPRQLARLTDTSLCHGWAGTYQTAWRAAQDAINPALHTVLPPVADALVRHVSTAQGHGPGLLLGDAGTALALTTAACDAAPASGWDACLLID
ncbi:lanthionine synthetase C family protein [Streptomyces sp. ISL-12]|uniref:lanthionine synthetase C family protein n=1 Tax=Streptomyces sp. ISL-12 TaxID=2819177 RepID=UPI001BE6C487|nr:lanthionine synthetase C family protein [Streptomyces sp. ISL-12]MBT2412075.1 lanthionine synthetase C family protein [Streptomyces sp. ISL-12]